MSTFLHTRTIAPVKALLQQGLSPQTLAFSLTIGFVTGFFPVFGITTILCIVIAGFFKLDQVVIQIANYCGYPLQFILFIPFVRLGELLFGLEQVSIEPLVIFDLARSDFSQFLELYAITISAACAAWLVVALPAACILWKALGLLLKKKMGSE